MQSMRLTIAQIDQIGFGYSCFQALQLKYRASRLFYFLDLLCAVSHCGLLSIVWTVTHWFRISHRYSDLSAFLLCFCLLSALWFLDALYTRLTWTWVTGNFAWSDDFVVMADLFGGCDVH